MEFVVNRHSLYPFNRDLRNEIKINWIRIENYNEYGKLVSDNIVSELIEKFISNNKYKNKIIFDGYPRNLKQAKNLDKMLRSHGQKIDIVLKLSVTLATVKKRILERQNQEKRADDNEEIAIKRYKTYENSSLPVLDYYKGFDLLKVVNGESTISKINTEISDLIDALKGWL